jgi:hypothetical protein
MQGALKLGVVAAAIQNEESGISTKFFDVIHEWF